MTDNTKEDATPTPASRTRRDITVKFYDDEIVDICDMTKVDAVAPAVRSIVRKAIEEHRKAKA